MRVGGRIRMRGHCGEAERRVRRRGSTIPQDVAGSAAPQLDRLRRFDDDAALHKARAGASRGRARCRVDMNAPLPADPRVIRSPAPPAPRGRRARSRPAFAGCACRCRSRSTTSTCGCSPTATAWTQVDCGYGDAATRALWRDALRRRRSPAGRSPASSRRTTIPITSATRAWLAARFGCPVDDAAGRIPDRARDRRASTAAIGVGADVRAVPRARLVAEHLAALEARGNRYRRGVPELPVHFRAAARRTTRSRIGAIALARDPGLRAFARARVALLQPSSACCISGDMLLPRISTNVSVWPVEPDGDPLARFLDSLDGIRRASRRRRWCCPRTACRSSASGARVEQLRAHHAARLAELEAAATTPKTAADDRAGAVPSRARPAAALFRDGRGDRAPEPSLASRASRARGRQTTERSASSALTANTMKSISESHR